MVASCSGTSAQTVTSSLSFLSLGILFARLNHQIKYTFERGTGTVVLTGQQQIYSQCHHHQGNVCFGSSGSDSRLLWGGCKFGALLFHRFPQLSWENYERILLEEAAICCPNGEKQPCAYDNVQLPRHWPISLVIVMTEMNGGLLVTIDFRGNKLPPFLPQRRPWARLHRRVARFVFGCSVWKRSRTFEAQVVKLVGEIVILV